MPERRANRNQFSTIKRQGAIRRKPAHHHEADPENPIFAYLLKLWSMSNAILPDVVGRVPEEHRTFVSHLLGVLKICLLLLALHMLFRVFFGS